MRFRWHRISAADRHWRSAHARIRETIAVEQLWGAFFGLFGIGSNELFVVTSSDTAEPPAITGTQDFDLADSCLFEPTVRPRSLEPLDRDGLYVFRFFAIDHTHVDEIARLSSEAWAYFERDPDYQAIPQALFAQADRSAPQGRMLLVTWYDGFGSWQTSRQPHAEATDRFQRRHRLMSRATPYATRLIVPDGS